MGQKVIWQSSEPDGAFQAKSTHDGLIERADVREFRENWDSPQSVPGDLG